MIPAPNPYADINRITFQPEGFWRVYEVTIRVEEGQQEDVLRFKQEIKCLEATDDGHYIFETKRDPVGMNDGQASDNPASSMAEDCGNVLYPLQIKVNAEGRVVQIHNHEVIKQRWTELKPKLAAYYVGDIAEGYIGRTENTILDATAFKQMIRNDIFMNLFFAPLYRRYERARPQQLDIPFPVIAGIEPLLYSVSLQLKTERDDQQPGIVVEQNGNHTDDETAADNVNTFSEGSMKASYHLHPRHFYIEEAEGRWTITDGTGRHSVTATLINIDDYSVPYQDNKN
ncbi:MAG: hypothetical protein EOP49_25075 [Sphingobacteriales bacterium]|nr:MAG: hypothetical protein EOP49_25075 [Sphingobacteriales bacterium]